MKVLPFLAASSVLVLAPPANAANYYVPEDFPEIQDAIDAAALNGDSVLVSPGNYPEDILISGKTVHIRALDGPSSTSLISARWDPAVNDPPEMTGGTLAGFHVLGELSATVPRDRAVTGEFCVVDGLTRGGPYGEGGTITLSRCTFHSDVLMSGMAYGRDTFIHSCTFLANADLSSVTYHLDLASCVFQGGAILVYVEGSEGLIRGNSVLGGPGMEVESGGAIISITDNTLRGCENGIVLASGYISELTGNFVTGSARGIDFQAMTSVDVMGNELRDCGTGIGGAVYNPILQNTIYRCGVGVEIAFDVVAPIEGNTIVGCESSGVRAPGGFHFEGRIERNISVGNGVGFDLGPEADPARIRCNDAWSNTLGNWTGVPDQTGINGNISADPLFCNEDRDDYRLYSCSPCLGTACGSMGAQGVGCYCPAGAEEADRGGYRDLLACIPNPFGERCVVTFDLGRAGPVRLAAYDVSGRLVSVILDCPLVVGSRHVEWRAVDQSGRGLGSGVYFLRLDRGGKSVSLPVVRVK